jgi:K+-transporting ATPase ATPase C chain
MKEVLKQFRIAFVMVILLTIVTGLIYPGVITLVAQIIFPHQANGSLLQNGSTTIGSKLIGQQFSGIQYFWSRPSATSPFAYNASSSSASNLGPTNSALLQAVQDRIAALKQADPTNNSLIPVDLVTSSASGLDPEISPYAAYYQVHRVALARHLPDSTVRKLVQQNLSKRQFGFLGEPRVNVLQLNLALDALTK